MVQLQELHHGTAPVDHLQLPLNRGGGEEKALYTDTEGTFLPELPTELWSHILLLAELPLKTLINLTTNKAWKLAITSDWFVKDFEKNGSRKDRELMVQGNRVWEFYVYSMESNTWREIDYPREVLKRLIQIVGASRGLLLVMVPSNNTTLFLWNPSLRRVRDLEVPPGIGKQKGDVVTMGCGVGFKAEVHQYEVICILCAETALNEVLLYNISLNTWRSLFLSSDRPLHFRSTYGFYFGNSFYWCLDRYDGVLVFNMVNESLRILRSPAWLVEEEEEILGMHAGQLQNEVAVIVHHRQLVNGYPLFLSISIFILKEDVDHPWIKKNHLCVYEPVVFGRPLSRSVSFNTGIYDEGMEAYRFVLMDAEDYAMLFREEFETGLMVMPGNDGEVFVDEYTETLELL